MIICKLENINKLERILIMRYAQLREMDITDGAGIRVSLYTQGCNIHCGGCFQKSTWSYKGGKEYTQETEDKIISLCGRSYIKGLSLLGGEPLSIQNYNLYYIWYRDLKKNILIKNIWIWSGDEIENYPTGLEKEYNCVL